MSEIQYGLVRDLGAVDFQKAREATEASMKSEGFGTLTEIDVKATMKKKIDVEMNPYVILGACNPQLAHQALQAEPQIGLLLPCNIVLQQNDSGNIIVSAIDPVKMFEVVGRDDIKPIAEQVRQKMANIIEGIKL
ncbi:MAG TPA: ABC transporter ATP-binding protein [Myxococcales bacterium]|nr:ABC transporter ATP-binding protein [Deltaproteobacteria bacterium]HAA54307.1 ABC transporter ATP-binding protein [Myxococcales bacterium]|tara:strand:+ start:3383 stop:3787 length:405 start_codon:yes stop_codon:yes gene_type:complete